LPPITNAQGTATADLFEKCIHFPVRNSGLPGRLPRKLGLPDRWFRKQLSRMKEEGGYAHANIFQAPL